MADNLGVFAKYWEPGKVKTRLAASIGKRNSAVLYRQMLQTLLRRLDRVQVEKTIYFDPPEQAAAFEALAGEWDLMEQPAGDLEVRLKHYFRSKLRHHSKVVVVGSDCPHLSAQEIEEAFALLDDTPMVIGPAADGGYYLLGLREPADFLFEAITWSSEVVFQQTIHQAMRKGLLLSTLNVNFDMDDEETLTQFVDCYRGSSDSDLQQLARLGSEFLDSGERKPKRT